MQTNQRSSSELSLQNTLNPQPQKPFYNHTIWPSPLPKILVLFLGITDNKRIRHQDALALLSKELSCSVEEFLKMSKRNIADILFKDYAKLSWHQRPLKVQKILTLLEKY
jgi:hypothetical protein